ncbi:RNase H domain-containing protein [Forsythia ovata]|uniref:RNase H domain-containing protein n=1 Tax=Forsythia ovata TaxID=205694 RepID=A0ABD1UDJ9_9LAMI
MDSGQTTMFRSQSEVSCNTTFLGEITNGLCRGKVGGGRKRKLILIGNSTSVQKNWYPPPVGKLKLNTDMVVKLNEGFIKVGAVIWDHGYVVVVALAKRVVGFILIEDAEAL